MAMIVIVAASDEYDDDKATYHVHNNNNNNDDNIFCEGAVFLPDNDENIIIRTSPPVCSSLTKTKNNLVTDYAGEEREGIEFISDVNIVDGEPNGNLFRSRLVKCLEFQSY